MNDFADFPDMCRYYTEGTRAEVVGTTHPKLKHPFFMRRNSSDIKNFEQVIQNEEYRHCVERLHNPSIILDMGAYVGWSALYFKNAFPDATIICVEPSRDNFEILKLNTKPYDGIHCINAAVWVNHNAIGYTLEGFDGDWGNRIGEMALGNIKTVTINDLIKRYKIERIDLLKVDIETSEKRVFSENTSWVRLVDAVAVELHDRYLYGCTLAFDALFSNDFEIDKRGETTMAFRRRNE